MKPTPFKWETYFASVNDMIIWLIYLVYIEFVKTIGNMIEVPTFADYIWYTV